MFILSLCSLYQQNRYVPPGFLWSPKNVSALNSTSEDLLINTTEIYQFKHDLVNEEGYDWREIKPKCLFVRNRSELCDASWAFAAVEAMGDQRCIAGKDLARGFYSEQFISSCSQNGCNGGKVEAALNFLQNTGVPTSKCSVFRSVDGKNRKCQTKCDDKSSFTGFTKIATYQNVGGEASMLKYLQKGVLIVEMKLYSDFAQFEALIDDIYHHTTEEFTGKKLAAIIVGYGTNEEGIKYWIVKNSLGAKWGEDLGYFKVLRGTDECGIESDAYLITP